MKKSKVTCFYIGISCLIALVQWTFISAMDASSINGILNEKFEENYEVIEIYDSSYQGRDAEIYRVSVGKKQYLMHFKRSGKTVFSDYELYSYEAVKSE